jgi:hypothetical protein
VLVDGKPVTFPSNEVRVTTPAAGAGMLTVRADEGAGQATELRHLVQMSEACPDGRDYRRVLTDIATLRRLRLHKVSGTPAVRELDELLRLAGTPR